MITWKEMKGNYSFLAFFIRVLGLSLFFVTHPFPASIANELLDMVDDIPVIAPEFEHKTKLGLMEYQIPDKIIDYVLYGVWLSIPIMQKKWFASILLGSYLFRGIGIYLFIRNRDENWLTTFPNFFVFWYFLFYGLEYLGIDVTITGIGLLMIGTAALKYAHENYLRNIEFKRKITNII